jgi:flagellar basal-body rod protein FlgG
MFGNMNYKAVRSADNALSSLNKTIENISNINSVGYKKSQQTFVEALNGEASKHEDKDFSQGPLRKTSELYDLALDGPGFFEIELSNGQRAYTRSGRLKLTAEGELVTNEGYRVIPEVEPAGKPIIQLTGNSGKELGLNIKVATPKLTIPAHLTPEILEDGTVNGINESTGEKVKLGKVNVVAFNNPSGLESIGNSYYVSTKSSGSPIDAEVGPGGNTRVKQGYLEFGNVNIATEIVNLTQSRNILSAHFKLFKIIDKIYENIHYTISKSV